MKIQVNDEEFNALAEDLKTTPENLVKIVLENIKEMPVRVKNEVRNGRTLDDVLGIMIKNSEPSLMFNDIIKGIIGEHDYFIEDGGYDLKEGTFWFEIVPGDTDLAMDSLLLQFGTDPGIVATAYFEVHKQDVDLSGLESEVWRRIGNCKLFEDPDRDEKITFDYDGEYLTCNFQVDTPGEFLNLPTVDEVNEVMSKIKKIIFSINGKWS